MTRKGKRNKTSIIIENTLGWYGAFATLSAYLLVSLGILHGQEISYQVLNLSGAIGLGIICYFKRTYQPLFVNIIWALIAVIALVDILFFIKG